MASMVWILWLGVVLGSCSAGPRCPSPCLCPPATLTCQGCPKDYLILSNDTQLLSVNGCKNIEYLLKLHSSHLESEQTKYSLHKLEITDSFMDKVPESYISNEYPIQSLNFSNNLIQLIEPGLEANNLTHLDLSHNRLSFIGNRTFHRMKNMLYLDLSANFISNLSVDSFVGLEKLAHLDLAKNNLTNLKDALFVPVAALQQLNLSYNTIEVLSEKCFGNLMFLQQLDISYNRLTNVAPGTLQLLPNLAKLLLADNPQLKPDAQIFVGTGRRLQQVDASRTGLRRVPEALTHSVRYLSLAGNRISALRCGDLDGYPLLHMLDISDNIIENVEDDALGRLEMISRLYLDKNKLQTIPKMLPDKLTHLSVDNNLIQNLTISDFTTLTNLKELILSNNLISYIQENAFAQLISLEILEVSNNPIQILTPNTFGGPLYLKILKICNVSIAPPARDISFPVPFPERMEELYLQYSPGITREFLADTAALAAMTRLQYLDMSHTNTTFIRSDLLHYLPEIKHIKLDGNHLNCSELSWLVEWMKESRDEYENIFCAAPAIMRGLRMVDLPSPTTTHEPITTKIISKPTFDTKTSRTITQSNFVKNLESQIPYNTSILSSSKLNISDVNVLKKVLFTNITNDAKNLLDLQSNEQYRMIFKHSKKLGDNQGSNNSLYETAENLAPIPRFNVPTASLIKNDSGTKKINNDLSAKATSANTVNNKNKLIEIFSQLSQKEEYNGLNVTNKMKKMYSTTDVSVPLCNTNGNSNGTENKTKCLSLPEDAAAQFQSRDNIASKQKNIIYRKGINLKVNDNLKLKNWKYVSVPKEYSATISRPKGRKINVENAMSKTLSDTDFNKSLNDDEKSREKKKGVANTPEAFLMNLRENPKRNNSMDESLQWKEFIREKQYEQMKSRNLSHYTNTTNPVYLSTTFTESIENVSQHQTLELKAEESFGISYLGIGFLVAGVFGFSAFLIITYVSRKRLASTRPRGPEIMEVQTISAVGELW